MQPRLIEHEELMKVALFLERELGFDVFTTFKGAKIEYYIPVGQDATEPHYFLIFKKRVRPNTTEKDIDLLSIGIRISANRKESDNYSVKVEIDAEISRQKFTSYLAFRGEPGFKSEIVRLYHNFIEIMNVLNGCEKEVINVSE